MVKLGDVVNFKTGKLNANAMQPGGLYPFFTCSQENYQINSYAFDCEALLLSGNNARAVYSVKYYKGKFNAYQRTYVITLKNKQNSYPYVRYVLETNLAKLKSLSVGSSTKYLTLGLLTKLPIFMADTQEQQEIGKILDLINQKIEASEKIRDSKIDLFNSIINPAPFFRNKKEGCWNSILSIYTCKQFCLIPTIKPSNKRIANCL